jgi:hypothetical protein
MSKSFKGVIAGVTYTDPAEFEKAARACGYRLGMGRTGDWRVGTPVRIRFDGPTRNGYATHEYVEGQVWAKGASRGTVWVALDDGRYARVWTDSGTVQVVDASGQAVQGHVGRVAA